jgi:hypothetical protein
MPAKAGIQLHGLADARLLDGPVKPGHDRKY